MELGTALHTLSPFCSSRPAHGKDVSDQQTSTCGTVRGEWHTGVNIPPGILVPVAMTKPESNVSLIAHTLPSHASIICRTYLEVSMSGIQGLQTW